MTEVPICPWVMMHRYFRKQQDYPTFVSWWMQHTTLPAPPRDMLPETGIVVEDADGDDLAMVFLFGGPGAGTCFLGFHVTNPGEKHGALTHKALVLAVEKAVEHGKAVFGCQYFIAYTDVRAVGDSLEKNKFLPASRGTLTDYVLYAGGEPCPR